MKSLLCLTLLLLCIVGAAIGATELKTQYPQQQQKQLTEDQNQQQQMLENQQQQYNEQGEFIYRQQLYNPSQQQHLYDRLQRQQQHYAQQLQRHQQQTQNAWSNSRSGTQQAKPSKSLAPRFFEFIATPRIDGSWNLTYGGKIIIGTLLSLALIYIGLFIYGYFTGNPTFAIANAAGRSDPVEHLVDIYQIAQRVYNAIEKYQHDE
ncbi:hypothetical protein SK128_006040 [Halocaridina rubra]|uniref:Uncharacterized protein n=1 Tax=Halocaridina rubra TaxID=373956 RepID=A0AAN8WJ07_HALRR